MWFDSWSDIGRVIVMALLIYASVVFVLRVAGKRSLAKLNIFDSVVTIALGSTLATIVLRKDVWFAEGLRAFSTLAGLQWAVARLSIHSAAFRELIRSDPRLLVRDGQFLDAAMREERVTRGEVEAAIRKKGGGRIEDIAAVVLETDGSFSVISGGRAEEFSALAPLLTRSGRGSV